MKVKINNRTVTSQYPPFSTPTPPTLIEDTKTSDCSDPFYKQSTIYIHSQVYTSYGAEGEMQGLVI